MIGRERIKEEPHRGNKEKPESEVNVLAIAKKLSSMMG